MLSLFDKPFVSSRRQVLASTCGGAWALLASGCGTRPRAPVVVTSPPNLPSDAPGIPLPPMVGFETNNSAWHVFNVPGQRSTRYESTTKLGKPCVAATSERAISSLQYRKAREMAGLSKLRFSWLAEELIKDADLTDVDSDDSPVRIFLAFDGDHSRLSLRNRMLFDLAETLTNERPPFATLQYVWENKLPIETVLRGNRSDRLQKIVVESGPTNLGRWLSYERDFRADFQRAFGEAPGRMIGVGVITDGNSLGVTTRGWYGNIELV
jgi:hypothetical protein